MKLSILIIFLFLLNTAKSQQEFEGEKWLSQNKYGKDSILVKIEIEFRGDYLDYTVINPDGVRDVLTVKVKKIYSEGKYFRYKLKSKKIGYLYLYILEGRLYVLTDKKKMSFKDILNKSGWKLFYNYQ